MTIQGARIRDLNDEEATDGLYVLYWMQQSQRAAHNPALELAVRAANERSIPVVVGFGLMDDYPDANLRHYAFMLEGLVEVEAALRKRGIAFVLRHGSPDEVAIRLARDSAVVVTDRGYLRHQKAWRTRVAAAAGRRVVQVEGDVVVPVEVASAKAETAARTLRPKIHKAWDDYLVHPEETSVEAAADALSLKSEIDLADVDAALRDLKLERSIGRVTRFKGGLSEARGRLDRFIGSKLEGYGDGRSEPAAFQCSMLSPYLHFGQISPVEVALVAQESQRGSADDRGSFLEELIVRRELAMNYCEHTEDYDSYNALPNWARVTLEEHKDDEREHVYTRDELQAAKTHDRFWNAAMKEMVHTGYMHNYMRMYWAKKILEWSATPESAYETALALNNAYFLDGRDPNSYANVAWCFGLHDRGWTERPVFGKIRYMNANGLQRKFNMKAYIAVVDDLVAAEKT